MRAPILLPLLLAVVGISVGCAQGGPAEPAPRATFSPRHGGTLASSADRVVEVVRTPEEIRAYFYRADGTLIPPQEVGYARVRWSMPEGQGRIDVLRPQGEAMVASNTPFGEMIEITTRGGGTRRFLVRFSTTKLQGGSP